MKIGLALGGGGVRGFAHVAALETLDSLGLRPAAISGTSMGAIMGAWYASGHSGEQIRERLHRHIISQEDGLKEIYKKKRELIKWLSVVRPAWGASGLFRADGALSFLLEEIAVGNFEQLEIPLQVVAADFYRGEPVVFSEGELRPAIEASMSIPGIFVPVMKDGRVLVDGGVVNNLPYDILPEDCDVTIAIDVNPPRDVDAEDQPSLLDVTLGIFDILIDQMTAAMLEKQAPTIYIRPKLGDCRILDFDRIEDVLQHAEPAMEELKRKLEELDSSN